MLVTKKSRIGEKIHLRKKFVLLTLNYLRCRWNKPLLDSTAKKHNHAPFICWRINLSLQYAEKKITLFDVTKKTPPRLFAEKKNTLLDMREENCFTIIATEKILPGQVRRKKSCLLQFMRSKKITIFDVLANKTPPRLLVTKKNHATWCLDGENCFRIIAMEKILRRQVRQKSVLFNMRRKNHVIWHVGNEHSSSTICGEENPSSSICGKKNHAHLICWQKICRFQHVEKKLHYLMWPRMKPLLSYLRRKKITYFLPLTLL